MASAFMMRKIRVTSKFEQMSQAQAERNSLGDVPQQRFGRFELSFAEGVLVYSTLGTSRTLWPFYRRLNELTR